MDIQTNAVNSNKDKALQASKLAELRAKLISRRSTPSDNIVSGGTSQKSRNPEMTTKPEVKEHASRPAASTKSSSAAIDKLVAAGRALADARAKEIQANHAERKANGNGSLTLHATPQKQSDVRKDPKPSPNTKPKNPNVDISSNVQENGEIRKSNNAVSSTAADILGTPLTTVNTRPQPQETDAAQQISRPPPKPTTERHSSFTTHTRLPDNKASTIAPKTSFISNNQAPEVSQGETNKALRNTVNEPEGNMTFTSSEGSPLVSRNGTAVESNLQLPDHLCAWLEMTGWFDEDYRQRALERHQKRRRLNYEMAQLDQEEEADKRRQTRAQSVSIVGTNTTSAKPFSLDGKIQNVANALTGTSKAESSRKRSLSPAQDFQPNTGPVPKAQRVQYSSGPRDRTEPKSRPGEDRSESYRKENVDKFSAQRPLSARIGARIDRSASPRPRGMTSSNGPLSLRSNIDKELLARQPYRDSQAENGRLSFHDNRNENRRSSYHGDLNGNRSSFYHNNRNENRRSNNSDRRSSYNEESGPVPRNRYAEREHHQNQSLKVGNGLNSFHNISHAQQAVKLPARASVHGANEGNGASSLELSRGG